jgi:hypothetical protein
MVFNFGQDTIVGFKRHACAQELAVSSYFNSGQILSDTKYEVELIINKL